MNDSFNPWYRPWLVGLRPLVFLAFCLAAACSAAARDLPAVSDGRHLWLVTEDPDPGDEAGLVIYHLAADAERGRMVELDGLTGTLMPRGVAAGDGRLLLVLEDRKVLEVRPQWSELLRRWTYTQRTLPAVPDGVAVLAVAVGQRGPWALVRVESADALTAIDQVRKPVADDEDRSDLIRALGFPEGFDLDPPRRDEEEASAESGEVEDADPSDDASNTERQAPAESDGSDHERPENNATQSDGVESSARETEAEPEPVLPVYRLIRLHQSKWVSSPLPDAFPPPRHASLVLRPGEARPTILIDDAPSRSVLKRFIPSDIPDGAADGDADLGPPAWQVTELRPQTTLTSNWSAVQVDGQHVLVVERSISETSVTAEVFLLRGAEAVRIGDIELPSQGRARWSAAAWRGGVALVAQPGPTLREPAAGAEPIAPLGGLTAITLDGAKVTEDDSDNGIVVLYEDSPTPLEGNADLLIQILAFLVAMVVMMLFYRRAPRGDQIDLPDDLVLASFNRRLLAGLIDLMPGFWLAGFLFDISVLQTIEYWPGNGVAKALPAMRPGFLVIGVTLLHTTILEFVTARSLGKWMTGLYVAGFDGKPAPPTPSLLRAASRIFDLFAPLMLVLMVISPGRQRLGDILAKTIVVMRLPEEADDSETSHDDRNQ